MDVVLIPCWRRAELLWHVLANIQRAEGADQLHYIFRPDIGHSSEILEVIREFPFSKEVAKTPPSRATHTPSKQSFSVLSGYHLAAQQSTGMVYMIEEDIFVATDFFKWHKAVHAQNPNLFCSIAVENHNRTIHEPGAFDEYYLTTLDYCSWGPCFHRDTILHHIVPAATWGYYTGPKAQCIAQFPGYPANQNHSEQDGLIRRVQWKLGMDRPIAYPYQGRAYHAGLYGYNRGKAPSGTLAQRIKFTADTCYSEEAMRILAGRPEWADDSRPINLTAEPWNELKVKPLDLVANPPRL